MTSPNSKKSKGARKTNARRITPRVSIESFAELPYVKIDWTPKQLEKLAQVLKRKPAKPTEALVRLMQDKS